MSEKTRKLTNLSILAAMAYITVALIRIPIIPGVEFLKFEPKDVIIAIGGFMYGPVSAMLVSVVVSLVEMVTISTTGFIGAIMNILGTCAFCCTAAFIYEKIHTLKGAIIGLIAGSVFMTIVMILWNYLITPMYMGYPREAVAAMLVPVFLPFNILKSAINAALTMLLYKPLSHIMRHKTTEEKTESRKGLTPGVALASVAALATLVLIILVMKGII